MNTTRRWVQIISFNTQDVQEKAREGFNYLNLIVLINNVIDIHTNNINNKWDPILHKGRMEFKFRLTQITIYIN